MHPADQADGRPDQHLEAADEEQPGAGGGGSVGAEQDAADDEPQPDEDVVADAGDFIPSADDELVIPDVQRQGLGVPFSQVLQGAAAQWGSVTL